VSGIVSLSTIGTRSDSVFSGSLANRKNQIAISDIYSIHQTIFHLIDMSFTPIDFNYANSVTKIDK